MRLSGSDDSMITQRILPLLVLGCIYLALPEQITAQSGAPYRGAQGNQSRIQLTQRVTANDTKPKKPLPYAIEEMPGGVTFFMYVRLLDVAACRSVSLRTERQAATSAVA